ncbi:MAG: hypothetical protein Q9159_001130 [Coniocarpon cinnabarinum]
MVLMDSFLKETARLHPGHLREKILQVNGECALLTDLLVGATRKVVSNHFSFRDGTSVPKGNWVALPQYHLMRDTRIYERANVFDGFRFVRDGESTSRFTHPAWNFTYWGTSKVGCPARFYIDLIAKVIFANLILDYEIKLHDPNAAKSWTFGLSEFPNPRGMLLMRKRPIDASFDL